MSNDDRDNKPSLANHALNRRKMLLGGTTLAAASAIVASDPLHVAQAQAQTQTTASDGKKPNILVVFGDDIGQSNISAYARTVSASSPALSWIITTRRQQ